MHLSNACNREAEALSSRNLVPGPKRAVDFPLGLVV